MISERQMLDDPDVARQEKLSRLEELIRDLDDRIDTPQGLMREHLNAQRVCLLGCMPQEYLLTAELAKELLPEVEPSELRARIEDFLRQ